jgi:hypothetical protein
MPRNRDGGRTALAGYLYQMVGALGMRAWADCSEDAPDATEIEAFIGLVQDGEVEHEYLDQDVGLQLQTGELVLVQFKFSSQEPPSKITPQELKEIADRLNHSARKALAIRKLVTGYVLITNRKLGPGAQNMVDAAKQGVGQHDVNNDQRSILEKLHIITELSLDRWTQALRNFAREFGLTDEEIETGVDQLIGNLTRRTVADALTPFTHDDLVYAFMNYKGSYPLIPEYLQNYSQKRSSDFLGQLGLRADEEPVRRQLLQEISEAVAERALVILDGDGGSGKTVGLWHWISSRVESLHESSIALSVVMHAHDVQRYCMAAIVCDCGDLPYGHPHRLESHEKALERLYIANSESAPPILFIGIDGLDEELSIDQKQVISDVLQWFWKEDKVARQESRPPRAALIVTCRDSEEVIKNWLRIDTGFSNTGQLHPLNLIVDDFSVGELLEGVRLSLPDLYENFTQTLQPDLLQIDNNLGAFGVVDFTRPAVNEQILEALKHPAMWRSLLDLQPNDRYAVLNGDAYAIQELSRIFIRWFCSKALKRGFLLEEAELLQVLQAVADSSLNNNLIQQTRVSWIDSACSTQLVTQRGAEKLYREALSAGMIRKDDKNHWRWRHLFICDYLANNDL